MQYGSRQNLLGLKPSKAVMILLGINVAIVVVTGVSFNYFGSHFLFRHLGLTPNAVVEGLELWQPFTYFWLHSLEEPSHLVWNLLALWLFSGPLERLWGTAAFVRFYLICGFGTGLVVLGAGLFLHPETITVGASGAILAMVAAFGILFPNHIVHILGVFPVKGRTVAIFFAVISTFFPLLSRHSNVSIDAHLGGLVLGSLYATGYWNPASLIRRLRLASARRRLRVLEGRRDGGDSKNGGNGPGSYVH